VTTALRDAQTAGVIRSNIPATHLCLALLNMLNWAALWFRKDKELSTDAVAEIFVQVYLNGARADASRGLPAIPSKSSKPRKRLKASESATVDRLLDAAAALFARQGYTVTTTREVAALLGMQKASLYHHIESKEDLLFLICRSSLERIRTDVETAIEGFPDPLDGTHALICAHVESLLRDADEHSTTLAEMHALSPHRLSHVAALREGYVGSARRPTLRCAPLRHRCKVFEPLPARPHGSRPGLVPPPRSSFPRPARTITRGDLPNRDRRVTHFIATTYFFSAFGPTSAP
jgi:AcrR family transcriptional regulator